MPAELVYPGVYVQEVPSGVRAIGGVSTSVALFIGWAPKGTIDAAVSITSFADFQREFGGLDARSWLGYAVSQFYANGGSAAWVIRLASVDAGRAACAIGGLTVEASSPGDWANGFGIVTMADDHARFRLDVTDTDGVVRESFADLSVAAGDQDHAPARINDQSRLIRVAAADGAAIPADGAVPLTGGTAGALLAPDASGPAGATFRTSLLALFDSGGLADRIDLFNLICVPALTDGATIRALQACAQARRAFLLADCDSNATIADVTAAMAERIGAHADHGAFYFPWVEAADPLQNGAVRAFPPSGFVAGIIARTDANRGVWKAPAGLEARVNGAAGLTIALNDAEHGRLNPHGVNCLRSFPVNGTVVWGARTMAGDDARMSEWKYIPVRRTALFIEESLSRGLAWAVCEPNDAALWAKIRLNAGGFMNGLFRQGAFQGSTPRDAYFVKCDGETTSQADIDNGVVNILIGFAPLKPAEFVILRLQQIAGQTAV